MCRKNRYDNDNEIYTYYFALLALFMFCLAIITVLSKLQ